MMFATIRVSFLTTAGKCWKGGLSYQHDRLSSNSPLTFVVPIPVVPIPLMTVICSCLGVCICKVRGKSYLHTAVRVYIPGFKYPITGFTQFKSDSD